LKYGDEKDKKEEALLSGESSSLPKEDEEATKTKGKWTEEDKKEQMKGTIDRFRAEQKYAEFL